jgi:hypothetical protein
MIFEYMFDGAFAVNTRPPTPSRNVRGCFVHTVLMWLLVLFRLPIHRFGKRGSLMCRRQSAATQLSTRTGTLFQPMTLVMATRLSPSGTIVYRGM